MLGDEVIIAHRLVPDEEFIGDQRVAHGGKARLRDHRHRHRLAARRIGVLARLFRALHRPDSTDFLIGPDYEAAHELCRGFDIVLANTLASWPVARAARVVGTRVVWYLHETLVARQFIARIDEIPSTLAMADLLVAPTRQTSYIYRGLVRPRSRWCLTEFRSQRSERARRAVRTCGSLVWAATNRARARTCC